MSQPEQQKKVRKWRWSKVFFALSLALNVAFVGAIAGTAYRFKDRRDGGAPPSLAVMLFRELDHDTRDKLKRHASGRHETVRGQRAADRKDLFAALRADPFVIEPVIEVLDRHSGRQAAFRQTVRQEWLNKLQNMSSEERAALAERMERRSKRHGHKKGH
ncbi:periplasmic heavy metal sensor [Epibacterium sp. SM1969]|uniref:Periplasmic heavy metal sensor n=1 Tax=Tritonibacter aquimaris TaxID=2663379 RepID=A0A844AZ35_9RHOB|nr:periplasmic heavy metal sensor [Tritonibacter aquimaris]MQY43232.1 periplasmic heavy metal sensor [Tritonibacter aquimaris]